MAGIDNEVIYGKNADYTSANNQNVLESNGLFTDGQIWIGRTSTNAGGTHIDVNVPSGTNSPVAPTTSVIAGAGTLQFEDRAWQTPYIVDPSSTNGLRGTFTTVQAAINQAVADGKASAGSYATIFVRNGLYAESLVIPDQAGIILKGFIAEPTLGTNTPVIIGGQITFTGTPRFMAYDINLFNSLGNDAITISANGTYYFENCTLSQMTINGTGASFNDCFFVQVLNINSTTQFTKCTFAQNLNISAPTTTIDFCNFISTSNIVVSSTAQVTVRNSELSTITGTFTGQVNLFNVGLVNPIQVSGGSIRYSNIYNTQNNNPSFFDPAFTPTSVLQYPQSQGNVVKLTKTATSYVALRTDYYIGVTNTAAARTITLPNTGSTTLAPFIGQVFIIKDESGAAGTNNITVTPNGGNIDGAASYVINTNYGRVEILFDGTNYFVINSQ